MKRFRAPTARRIPGTMNKLETAYHAHLQGMQDRGEIAWFGYESHRLKLAPNCTYTPDFMVLTKEGEMQAHEVKGGIWIGDARVKWKVCAEKYWFYRFVAVTRAAKKDGGAWQHEWFDRETE